MREREILRAAIKTWGPKNQLLMLAEESNELAVGIFHYLRGRPHALREVIAEAVDLEIMLAQVRMIFNEPIYRDEFRAVKRAKMKRLAKRLAEARENEREAMYERA